LRDHFKVGSLDGFRPERPNPAAIGAPRRVATIWRNTSVAMWRTSRNWPSISAAIIWCSTPHAFGHLEILEPLIATRPPGVRFTRGRQPTATPMGAGVSATGCPNPSPLSNPSAAQDAVQLWIDHPAETAVVPATSGRGAGPGAAISRLSVGTGNGRDLLALAPRAGTDPDAEGRF